MISNAQLVYDIKWDNRTSDSVTLTVNGNFIGVMPGVKSLDFGLVPEERETYVQRSLDVNPSYFLAGQNSITIDLQGRSQLDRLHFELAYADLPQSQVATPIITPNGGTFIDSVSVSFEPIIGATIYYTTDGSTPTAASATTIPFTLTTSATVKAIAIKSGFTDSDIATAIFTITTTTPPKLIINSPLDGQIIPGDIVNILYSASGDMDEVNHSHFSPDWLGFEVRDIDFDGVYQVSGVPVGPHVMGGRLVRKDHSGIPGSETSVSFSTVTTTNPPINKMPSVFAGAEITITLPASALLDGGTAVDDGLPNPPGQLTTTWRLVSGPGTVTFDIIN